MRKTYRPTRILERTLVLFSALFMSFFASGAIGAVESVKPSNAWRIECSGNAESAGTIQFRVLPQQGQVTTVTIKIEKGRGENEMAKAIRDAFRAQLPTDRFHAETDDGEDVLLKKKIGQPDFAIELVSSDVANFRMNLERE